jgi:hypothetical protein
MKTKVMGLRVRPEVFDIVRNYCDQEDTTVQELLEPYVEELYRKLKPNS